MATLTGSSSLCSTPATPLDLFLFGHTHRPLVDMRGRTLFLNPGSIGDYAHPFYGVVTIENGRLDGRTAALD
ncbi:metallophosphoesterase family protein [uncultured Oscillibacter sp.]|uniref:metallophosphoesterase family protein n=1 Tax=uncultured Oscillibacter sp. TaxID=876091 RepID=UPI002611B45D|nr:metallophosphoesterase family protein [uncultured Oscillibacter sp.]